MMTLVEKSSKQKYYVTNTAFTNKYLENDFRSLFIFIHRIVNNLTMFIVPNKIVMWASFVSL